MAVWFGPAVTPVITGDAYSQNDSIGGVIEIPGVPPSGTIMSITIQDDADQGPSMAAYFFQSEPAGVADHAALALSDADGALIIGVESLDTWFDLTDSQVLSVNNIAMPYEVLGGSLFMMLKDDDASPGTFVATDDLHIRLGIVY